MTEVTAPADVAIPAREIGSCVLCNGPDTLDLAVCLDCASRTGDGLVFVLQTIRKTERASVIERLHGILPPGVDWEAFDLASKGNLPLASVPLAAAKQVFETFADEGVATQVIPKRWGVAPIPPPLGLVLLSVLMVGPLVGLLTGNLVFLLSPIYAGLLWILAQLHLRRPAACGGKSEPWLPHDVEKRLVTALMSLPAGTPRTLLSDVVSLGRLLWERAGVTGDVDIVEDTSELMALAADAATDLARVEEAGRVMAGQPAQSETAQVRRTEALEAIEVSRQRLHDLLLDAVRSMGGANRRLSEAGGQGPELARLADAIEISRAAEAEASAEMKQLLVS
jgi:hypothetical protein